MADENPTPSSAPSDDPDKKETIRITLPPKGETPVAKRETVRVNLTDTVGITPKKETSKVTLPTSGLATPPPITRPSAPPIARPSAPPAPPPLSKPVSGLTPPPKPPSFVSKPTIPLKPAPSGVVPKPVPGVSGIAAKPASPKKETARISLPTDAPKSSAPALPKATVKMQTTQPLMKTGPLASGVKQAVPAGGQKSVSAASVAPQTSVSPAKSDTLGIVLSILAFLAAVGAGVFTWLVYTAATLPPWAQ